MYFLFFLFLVFFLFSSPCLSTRTAPFPSSKPINPTSYHKIKGYTWHEFQKFVDAGRGNKINGISELKKYFYRFGYLKIDSLNFTDLFDEHLEHALIKYQEKLGLLVNGKLDEYTVSQIISPRCGVSDSATKLFMHATRNYAFFTGKPRWSRSIPITLTYAFSPDYVINSLSMSEIKDAFQRAFNHWASVIPVSFWESNDYGFADIKIGFYKGDHGDGEPFDGLLGVLAHAFSPEIGRFHLDAAETWAVDFEREKSDVAIDLESVATHEIGHLLGLAHTSVQEAVMYPSLKPREKKVDLKIDDIKGIQALYGSNPNFSYQDLLESDTSTNSGVSLRKAQLTLYSFILVLILRMSM
ncbi:hypothetical protein CQW23_23855 [Capsicum baccatum]|uniref:Peptidase metallopeptidase domain-containing protein n=1 Tax=Capsicum baccatum TaxID=33114 RepID=A0A2G2VT51_CAPBA|nr:hypothetical protein CQW23_23855 [Capsicum baccatum]